MSAVPYTLGLLIPAILLSWWAGNNFGALAARRKVLDNTVLPIGYMLTATPYMWLAIVLAWVFGFILQVFPISGGYSYSLEPALTWASSRACSRTGSCRSLALPRLFGGWAIGMRNMIIYELECRLLALPGGAGGAVSG
jgi:peptide/nickel transport system permease protein